MDTLSACTWCDRLRTVALISNPDLPSETSDHRRECGERAAWVTSTEVPGGCGCEVTFQFRCSLFGGCTCLTEHQNLYFYKIKHELYQ